MQKLNQLIIFLVYIGFSFTTSAQTTILNETLLTQDSFNTFTPVSVTGDQGWNFSAIYGAVCSGYTAGQSYENEDWFISPVLNLSQTNNPQLTFSHTRGSAAVMNAGVAEGWYSVFATANYTGNPATTTWIALSGLNQNISTAWQYVSSGSLTIPDAAKSASSRIAFRYKSSATQSATWEIKNVQVTGEQSNNPGPTSTFKITNWNTEWLGCTQYGPDDEALQISNVVAAMRSMNSDLYCIQEVTNTTTNPTIATLVSQLGSDVWAGSIVPTNTGECTQRQGIIYKKDKVQLVSSSQLSSGSGSYNYNWSGGRFPALYNLNLITANGTPVPVSIVNIHAKAEDDNASSYTRRQGASEALKIILDGTNYNAKNVIVIGDFNDYLTGTTSAACQCTDSPYKNFVDDVTNYNGITKNITDVDTRFGTHPIIENIIISNELTDNYVSNSAAQEVIVSRTISRYYTTTSNHLPVSATFQFSALNIPENHIANLVMYPNPVKDILNINFTTLTDTKASEIYDVTGRQIATPALNNNTINVSGLPAGIYILKIGEQTGRFIKQ
ncbi:T9SS-dependent choice-of-anchor J family protein [Flavobacterium psychrotrophum]|uniref:T9SS-dependent choice-of-anchor J family protein n=1 Tax=Flavobacterium psychrotrophum TaxID=2294119 RepID=UPI000E321B34|nr:T9SS type A sorting domain-containing protein [Flavobacterium psychrotrophum]